jgi:hypothetical protein
LDKVRAGPDARQASGVPAGGKEPGGFEAAAHPQMMTPVLSMELFIRIC